MAKVLCNMCDKRFTREAVKMGPILAGAGFSQKRGWEGDNRLGISKNFVHEQIKFSCGSGEVFWSEMELRDVGNIEGNRGTFIKDRVKKNKGTAKGYISKVKTIVKASRYYNGIDMVGDGGLAEDSCQVNKLSPSICDGVPILGGAGRKGNVIRSG